VTSLKKKRTKRVRPNVPRTHLKTGERNGVLVVLCKTNPEGVWKWTLDEKEITCLNCETRIKELFK